MKKLLTFFAITLVITMLPAWAWASQEQVIYQQVTVGYFDIWKHVDGTWQDTNHDGSPDIREQTGKTAYFGYQCPQKIMNEYKLTRVNVTVDINREKYEAAGGRFGLPWDKFDKTFMPHMPDNYSAVIAHPDLTNGKTSVKATLDLSPVERALDRKEVRFPGDENIDFSHLAEGWRWYLPMIVTWYGISKDEPPQELPEDQPLGEDESSDESSGHSVDLAATDLIILDADGNEVTELKNGKEYTVRATYENNSDLGGYAEIRLYQKAGNEMRLIDETWIFMEPNCTLTYDFKYIAGSLNSKLISAINREWKGYKWEE